MTTQPAPGVTQAVLADRITISMDWLPTLSDGQPKGQIRFDNATYYASEGVFFARDAQPATTLTLDLADVLAFSMPLPEGATDLTGDMVREYITTLHREQMVALAARRVADEAAARDMQAAFLAAQAAADRALRVAQADVDRTASD